MIIDGRQFTAPEISTQICIVGGGPAGITIALELEQRGIPVAILESGGRQEDQPVQDLARGEITGRIYYPLEKSRLRFFGGSGNHWGGLCCPMDSLDFQARPWIPGSGWPFDLNTLNPYYERAREYLTLDPFPPAVSNHATFQKRPADFELDFVRFSRARLLTERFGTRLKNSKLISIYLYCNLTEFITDDSGRVRTAVVRTLPEFGGRTFAVRADTFVLATGGIENARLLLLSERNRRTALGNQHGHVGRYFMEHIHGVGAVFAVHTPDFPFTDYEDLDHRLGYLRLKDNVQRQAEILNCRLTLKRAEGTPLGPLSQSVFDIAAHMDGQRPGPRLFQLEFVSEQSPTRESFVTLSQAKDSLGQERIALHWEISDLDKKTIDTNLRRAAHALAGAGHGRLQIRTGSASEFLWDFIWGGNHHMGTTRMHPDPRLGVVNVDSRLHDVPNLYVAGSSVFPNAGHANPTFTIVALAVRMADHLAESRSRAPKPGAAA